MMRSSSLNELGLQRHHMKRDQGQRTLTQQALAKSALLSLLRLGPAMMKSPRLLLQAMGIFCIAPDVHAFIRLEVKRVAL